MATFNVLALLLNTAAAVAKGDVKGESADITEKLANFTLTTATQCSKKGEPHFPSLNMLEPVSVQLEQACQEETEVSNLIELAND